jgi:hypothetical protein
MAGFVPGKMRTLRINLIFFTAAIVIFIFALCFEVNFLNYKPPIAYTDWKNIGWSDFRGLNRPFHTLYGENQFAFIATEIKSHDRPDGSLEIVTYFHPSRSYVYNKRIVQAGLLKHELYHLHITEYVARLLRQSLTEDNESGSNDFVTAFAKFERIKDQIQQSYDAETYHGIKLQVQKRWEKHVDSCLQATSDYSNTLLPLME